MLLDICIQTMTTKLKLKKDVFKTSSAIFEQLLPDNNPDEVIPKNRRKRKAEEPLKYHKNNFKFLQAIEEVYGKDLTTSNLLKICSKLGLEVSEKAKYKRAQATLNIFSTIKHMKSISAVTILESLPQIV